MKGGDRIKFWVGFVFRILLIFAIGQSIWFGEWLYLFYAVLTLLLISLPAIIEKKTRIDWPNEFEIAIVVFLFAAIYLGEIHKFYYFFWWWDGLLHFISGLIIALLAFTLVWILNNEKRVRMKLSPGFVSLFAFCFALAIGGLWEIFEFGIDYFTANAYMMQETGIVDTMWDLILDSLGALVVSLLGYFYLKRRGLRGYGLERRGRIVRWFGRLERKFVGLNRGLFK